MALIINRRCIKTPSHHASCFVLFFSEPPAIHLGGDQDQFQNGAKSGRERAPCVLRESEMLKDI